MTGWSFTRGGPATGRLIRYLAVLGGGWAVVLVLAGLFYSLSPRTYESGFTLILPGAGPSSSVNLERLGQASSNSASPFGDHSLSPTENYKRLFLSYRLRGEVAEQMGMAIEDLPAPRIRLANQTKLIFISVTASSPEEARLLAETWLSVFEEELNALRAEEQSLRENAYRTTLQGFENAVESSRARIIAFQTEYGLISIEQFQDLVAQTERLKAQADQAATEMRVAESEISRLSSLMGMDAQRAADIMALLSDGSFQALQEARASAETRRAELSLIFGPNHPDLMSATEERAGLHSALVVRGEALLGYARFRAIDEQFYASSSERAGLVADLVQASSRLYGARQRHTSLTEQLRATQLRVETLAAPATQLDALLRDHQVAETVFASALARIDANRTDMFASYPLTQTVETPALPETPATPSKKFIALGTFAVMFLYTIGLALLWIRLPLIRALLKTL
ncbi:MAG: hypothetical protein MRY64_02390 [Hyphomonadaceae bacterium]|nr:hypothetical protein [Hyphomonadaceae bacterium]